MLAFTFSGSRGGYKIDAKSLRLHKRQMENIGPAILKRMKRITMSLVVSALVITPSLAMAHGHRLHHRASVLRSEHHHARVIRHIRAARAASVRPTGYLARTQRGIASVYATSFNRRKMANGARFSIWSNSAASRTLPLGTVALVTNVKNGRHVSVCIRDRGPYVGHRLLDMSPATAHALGMHHPGLMHITLKPLRIPAKRTSHMVEVAYQP